MMTDLNRIRVNRTGTIRIKIHFLPNNINLKDDKKTAEIH